MRLLLGASNVSISGGGLSPKVTGHNMVEMERNDAPRNIILRVYAPDLKRMKTWKAPKAEKI